MTRIQRNASRLVSRLHRLGTLRAEAYHLCLRHGRTVLEMPEYGGRFDAFKLIAIGAEAITLALVITDGFWTGWVNTIPSRTFSFEESFEDDTRSQDDAAEFDTIGYIADVAAAYDSLDGMFSDSEADIDDDRDWLDHASPYDPDIASALALDEILQRTERD